MNKREIIRRSFTGIIYPDSTNYNCADLLVKGLKYFDEFGYITHDKDIDEDTGERKKTHIHWIGRFEEPRNIKSVSNTLGLKNNEVEYVRSLKYMIRYLIHTNKEEKAQYNISDIKGTLKDLIQYFDDIDNKEK